MQPHDVQSCNGMGQLSNTTIGKERQGRQSRSAPFEKSGLGARTWELAAMIKVSFECAPSQGAVRVSSCGLHVHGAAVHHAMCNCMVPGDLHQSDDLAARSTGLQDPARTQRVHPTELGWQLAARGKLSA